MKAALLVALLLAGCAQGAAASDPYYHRCNGGAQVTRTTMTQREARYYDSYETTVWVECGL